MTLMTLILFIFVSVTLYLIILFQEMKSPGALLQPAPLLDFASGLVSLSSKKYKDAAKHFLKCQFDSFDFPEVKLLCIYIHVICMYNRVAAP